ncbi:hypothetical protein [Afipia felis]|uniref:Uncharacterized protein n=2 Tax=Afipia felis TaxID=1035 RepID=A0A380WCT0_AFIFE|nr:hypothetical protein [Afipia felis]EKS29697.1 hypothetical protein HMPREF9697_02225 [Afipia felis ATCC 53690]SUU78404.1 Uncharacterised protein [Afipia felis]SUU86469.1 Uncharacterised protein [Afipia felis]
MTIDPQHPYRPKIADRISAAVWWLLFIGFPVVFVVMIAAGFTDIPEHEMRRIVGGSGLLMGLIGFLYGRKLPGIPWAPYY